MLPLLRCLFWINFDGVFFFKVLISLVSTFGYIQKKILLNREDSFCPLGVKKAKKIVFLWYINLPFPFVCFLIPFVFKSR